MSPVIDVLMLQLPVPSSPALNTPLAAGYLAAYAEAQGLGELAHITILPRAIADHAGDAALVDAIVARAPNLLGLSLYTWNSERSLAVALRAKQRLPALLVVVGGPEVQPDNAWLLAHPAVDLAVIGEGEQTFAELLRALVETRRQGDKETTCAPGLLVSLSPCLPPIPGLAVRLPDGQLQLAPERVALAELTPIPSPYLAGHLELPPDGMQMIEISRWCPYACSFCLYGRNMGAKLGGRYFALERVLAEICWGIARGVRSVHFVEANLNLVPLFWPLMRALADLNAQRQLTFYAELRGEHLSDEVVAALDAANVRVVEVGLQTANPVALRASHRRTDLAKWAAGTRRLYAHKIEVLLDVILGLPADDAAGVAETLAFIEREQLGPYDIFTLQVLPGTAVRREASEHGLAFQERPPYFVLATRELPYAELRRLRRELKLGVGLDPDAVEGMPAPRLEALATTDDGESEFVRRLDLRAGVPDVLCDPNKLAAHVDLLLAVRAIPALTAQLAALIAASPATIFDLYLLATRAPPAPAELRAWRDALPHEPGYLDRVAVYTREQPQPQHARVSPRLWLVLPWAAQAEPAAYTGVAQIIWRYDAAPDEPLPLGAWRAARGDGIWLCLPAATPAAVRAAMLAEARAWAAAHGRAIWSP